MPTLFGTLDFFGILEWFSEGKWLRSKDAKSKRVGTLDWNGSTYFGRIVLVMEQWALHVGQLNWTTCPSGHLGQPAGGLRLRGLNGSSGTWVG
jgi:hypothetical protein